MILVCLLLALVMTHVVPQFAWLEHTPLRPILGLSLSPATVPVLACVLPGLIVLWWITQWRRSGRLGGGAPQLGWIATIAGSKRIFRWGEAARFAELLRLLVERGVPLDRSLRLAGEATGDRKLKIAATSLADEIHRGTLTKLTAATVRGDADVPTGANFPVLIRLALQHSGDRALLESSLRQAATIYHERAVRAAEWYAEYLPILLTIFIGGACAIGFTLFVLWPYVSMLYELSDWNWN
jgi:type II secretory pathway component PulF